MKNVIIIAEAGVNHNGDLNNAFKLIDAAKEAGVDYVKFQSFITDNCISKKAEKADYQKINTGLIEESQYEMVKKLELSFDEQRLLQEYCKNKEINFFSTAFDLKSLQYLKDIGLDLVKIPSGEITNYPYLKLASQLFSKVILSTGMCTIDDIQQALNIFLDAGLTQNDITILHCNTEYPTPMIDVNLLAMNQIREVFGTAIGYSDHTLGIEVPLAAVALGATVIEKHFTLDKNMVGPDHTASLEPQELKAMVKGIRNIELAISGSGIKEPSTSEIKNIIIARKSIVAAKKIKQGEIFSEVNITTKRPGNGISAMKWNNIIGAEAKRDFDIDDLIEI
ncbi:N-acetylneuraminate synthase [Empedobacter falsenii]